MYKILLEGRQLKRNQITGMHLMVSFILIGIGMVTWLVPDAMKETNMQFLNYVGLVYALLGFLILITSIFFNRKVIQTKANSVMRVIEIIALAAILLYSYVKHWYLPMGYSGAALLGILLVYYFEQNHKKDKVALFTDAGIHIPGLGRHSNAPWEEIKNIIIRHNILTVDFKNNKLYQAHISRNNVSIDTEGFSAFAKQQIEKNKEKYKADW